MGIKRVTRYAAGCGDFVVVEVDNFETVSAITHRVTVWGRHMGSHFRERCQVLEEWDDEGYTVYHDCNSGRIKPMYADFLSDAVDMAVVSMADIIPCPMLRIMLQVEGKIETVDMMLHSDLMDLERSIRDKQILIWLESDFTVNLQYIN